MTRREFDSRIDVILEALKTSTHFDDLEQDVVFRKGYIRPSEASGRYTAMIWREGITVFDMQTGGGQVEVEMAVRVALLTKNVGDYEQLETDANEFAARAYMALMDIVSRGYDDGDGWDTLQIEGSTTTEREPDQQDQAQEAIECAVSFYVTSATS